MHATVPITINPEKIFTQCGNLLSPKVIFNVNVFSSLVRAADVFCVLEKYDYLALYGMHWLLERLCKR
jgi:hypothetical protein